MDNILLLVRGGKRRIVSLQASAKVVKYLSVGSIGGAMVGGAISESHPLVSIVLVLAGIFFWWGYQIENHISFISRSTDELEESQRSELASSLKYNISVPVWKMLFR